jgi:hypothetical protein
MASSIAYQKKYSDKIIKKIMKAFPLENHFIASIFSKLGYIPFEAFTNGETKSMYTCLRFYKDSA